MPADAYMLLADDTQCRICAITSGELTFVEIRLPANATPGQIAALVSPALERLGYVGRGIVLGLPSAWCLSARIAVDDLPRHDRQAMMYRLEEKLPLAAENVIADFVNQLPGQDALGVCVAIDSVKPLVDALEAAGVAVQFVTSAALLAAQGLSDQDPEKTSVSLIGEMAGESKLVNVISIQDGVPISWALLPANVEDLQLQLDLAAIDGSDLLQIETCGVEPKLTLALAAATSQSITPRDESVLAAAGRAASGIIAGRQRPWVDFRRGPLAIRDSLRLYRKPLNAALAATAAVFLALIGVMVLRGIRYEHVSRADDRELAEAFHRQFPNWTTPGNIRAVVESEHRKVAGHPGGALPSDGGGSALVTLRDVLGRMPTDGRFTVDRMTFQDISFEIEGKLRSYEDVDLIATAGRQAGMDVASPQARKDAEGLWSFSVRGAKPGKTPQLASEGAAP